MELRRSAEPNARRRRVLMEEITASPDENGETMRTRRSRSAGGPTRNYSDAALAENLPRISDFIPTRWWMYALFLLASIMAIAGLEYLYLGMETWGESIGHANLSAFDPRIRGSLAGWFSSFALGLAFASSCVVFAIRRHKTDDYRGRYRMWLWVPFVLLAGSVDATTGVRVTIGAILNRLASHFSPDSWISANVLGIWTIGGSLLLFAAATRVLIEIRRSRAAMSFLLTAIVAYVTMSVIAFQLVWHELGTITVVASSATKLVGDVALLFASLSYARYVYMDAQGMIGEAKPKAKRSKRKAAETDDAAKSSDAESKESKPAESKRSDLDPVAKNAESREVSKSGPLAAFKKSPEPAKPSSPSSSDFDREDEDEDSEDDRGLTRAERKRLKKLGKKDDRRAA